MNRFQGVWTLWSASNGERAGEWVKCGEGGPEELADMLRCLFDWQRNGQRVRLEWSEPSEPIAQPLSEQCPGSGQRWTTGTGDRICPVCHRSARAITTVTGRAAFAGEVPAHPARTP